MEYTCEVKVILLWEGSVGLVLEKLGLVSVGLNKWYNQLRWEKRSNVQALRNKIEQLSALYPSDTMLELVDIQLALNLEVDKEDLYLE